jgi:leucyl-tRNA synthetase
MVLNEIFFRKPDAGRVTYYNPDEVELAVDANGKRTGATLRADGQPVESDGIGTMSKSKNNGVDPQSLIEEYGADTARLFMMFASPPEQTLEWSDAGVQGAYRFLNRLWKFAHERHAEMSIGRVHLGSGIVDWTKVPPEHMELRREIHLTLKQANYDFAKFQFNTVVSAGMKILNALERLPGAVRADRGFDAANTGAATTHIAAEGFSILLRLLSPITPHVMHHLWREFGYGEDILTAPWPEPDAKALEADEIELVLQVNGKLRGNMRVAKDAGRAEIERLAMQNANVQKHIGSQPVKKVVVVPGRLVNVVV